MRLFPAAAALAACYASSVQAFSDSSPFILFSTAKLETPASYDQIQSGLEIQTSARRLLASCPTDRYLIVSQPNINAAHLSAKDAVPRLRSSLGKAQTRYTVAEVAGQLDMKEIAAYIRTACEGRARPYIEEVDLAPLPPANGAGALKQNGMLRSILSHLPDKSSLIRRNTDEQLSIILDQYEAQGSYTIIYAGSPQTETMEAYTAEFQDAVHAELKRALHPVRQSARDKARNLPLFEKYQYFTPDYRINKEAGIFMGLIAFVVLMSILYAGISAVASLEVSYGAFDKEMGPAAQKKQQ
ncbi:hypothetical protein AAE478_004662 [Parahypoxylon ruwenzoriense]